MCILINLNGPESFSFANPYVCVMLLWYFCIYVLMFVCSYMFLCFLAYSFDFVSFYVCIYIYICSLDSGVLLLVYYVCIYVSIVFCFYICSNVLKLYSYVQMFCFLFSYVCIYR